MSDDLGHECLPHAIYIQKIGASKATSLKKVYSNLRKDADAILEGAIYIYVLSGQ